MNQPKSNKAEQVAAAAKSFEQERTGHPPKSVTVVLSDDALVITLHGALSEAETALAKDPNGAAKVQEFHQQLFASAAGALRTEIERITGVKVREATAEIEPSTGTVVRAFASGTVVQVFLLAGNVETDVWSNVVASMTAPRFEHALCVYPYRRELNEAGFFPPLGLEFVAAVVQRYARSLNLVDLRMVPGRTLDSLRPETDLVCFSVNWDRDREFLEEEIRSVPPGILTVIGGRHATEEPGRWLADFPNVDAVVRGDGEDAMDELCRGIPLGQIAGLSYRRDGHIHHNPNRSLGEVRNDLYPDRRIRRKEYTVTIKGARAGIRVDSIVTSRGCPNNCAFCSFNRNPWGEMRRWTARSPESVVDELREIQSRLVGFADDLFTHDMDRVERICDLIIARRIQKRYFVNARLEIAKRPDVLRKMERAGFSMLMLGVESAHDKTLRSMRKGFDVARIRKYFEILRQSRMFLHGYFILGCIGESVDEMLQIAPFAHELGLDTIALSVLRSSPHSGLDELVANSPGYRVAPSGKIYSDECSVAQLGELRKRIYRQFYSPGQIARVAIKGIRNDALSFLPGFLPRLPQVTVAALSHAWRKARHRARKRRWREALALLQSHAGNGAVERSPAAPPLPLMASKEGN